MSATASPVPEPADATSADQAKLLGALLADMFMPDYLNRPAAESPATAEPTSSGEAPATPSTPAPLQPAELLDRVRDYQRTSINSLAEANSRLVAFGIESDRLMPVSSAALAQHVHLVASVRKELEALERRVSKCMVRAERIKNHDEMVAVGAASVASTGGFSSPSPSSSTTQSLVVSPEGPTAVTADVPSTSDESGEQPVALSDQQETVELPADDVMAEDRAVVS